VGSVSEGVVSLAPCPILVVRGGEGVWPPTGIVVGTDFSEEARKASELAMSFGRTLGAEVLLVMAYQRAMWVKLGESDPRARVEADRAKRQAREGLSRLSAELENVAGTRPKAREVLGDAAAVIQKTAEEGEEPVLVAVGRRGMGPGRRFVLGSAATFPGGPHHIFSSPLLSGAALW
jgi:nucleotide-binding universal stress UspA family protein